MKTLSKPCITVCIALLFALILVLQPVSVHADNTTLTTQVPEQHTIKLTISGAGTVTINGTAYSASSDIPLPRHSEAEITVTAADGYILKTVYYNGEDVTGKFIDGKWTTPQIQGDATLSVSFLKKGTAPETGDSNSVYLLWTAFVLSLAVIILITRKPLKNCTKY